MAGWAAAHTDSSKRPSRSGAASFGTRYADTVHAELSPPASSPSLRTHTDGAGARVVAVSGGVGRSVRSMGGEGAATNEVNNRAVENISVTPFR